MRPAPWLVGVTWGLAACSSPSDSKPAPSPEPVRWAQVRLGSELAVLQAPARTVGAAQASAIHGALATGVVRRIHVVPGDTVEAGAPLLDLASPELADTAARWSAASRKLGPTKERLQRLKTLTTEALASQDRLQEARLQVLQWAGERDRHWARLQAHDLSQQDALRLIRTGGWTLRSRVDGVVTQVSAHRGAAVTPAEGGLVTVMGAHPARVEARVDQELDGLSLRFEGSQGLTLDLRLPPVASAIDPDSGLLRVWLEPKEPVPLRGDRVGVLVGRSEQAFEVPARSLFESESGTVLFVRKEVGTEEIPVQVVRRTTERAVVRGALRPNMEVSTQPALWAEGP